MKFWDIVKSVGRYQWISTILFSFLNFALWPNLGIVLFAPDLSFKCLDFNFTGSDQCEGNGTGKCETFEFDNSEFSWTLTERFSLVCDREWIIATLKSLWLAGQLFGSLTAGLLADRFGRKIVAVVTMIFGCFANVASSLVPSIWAYAAFRVMLAICEIYAYLSMLVYATEYLQKEQRFLPKLLDSITFDLGFGLLGAIYYLTSSYVNLHIIVAIFWFIMFVPFVFFTRESPRWLTAKNRHEKANKIVEKISVFNNTPVDSLQYLIQSNDVAQGNMFDLFRTPVLRKRTLILIVIWFTYILSYYAIVLNLGDFTNDVRMSFIISGAVELCLSLPAAVLMNRLGRPMILFVHLLGAGICCLAMAPFVEDKANPALITLALIGKLLLGNTYFITFTFTPELFPTVLRVSGLGVCSTAARIVAIVGPQLRLLNVFWPPMMVVILGMLIIVVAFLVPLLPDMTDVELPQTIEDGERLFAGHGYSLRKAKAQNGREALGKKNSTGVTTSLESVPMSI